MADERSWSSSWRELPLLLGLALVLAVLLRTFLLQVFVVPSGSMERTLHGCPGCTGDRVVVDKLVHDVRDVRRGEVVVFRGTGSWAGGEEDDYVKRVVGIAGDRVGCCTADGRVTVQPVGASSAVALDEPYVFGDDARPFCAAGTGPACGPGAAGVLVPPGRLWVMGDHRGGSADSRAHLADGVSGTVPQDAVVGRAVAVVWPLHRLRRLRVPAALAALSRSTAPAPRRPGTGP